MAIPRVKMVAHCFTARGAGACIAAGIATTERITFPPVTIISFPVHKSIPFGTIKSGFFKASALHVHTKQEAARSDAHCLGDHKPRGRLLRKG
jgi:hypothetical protein